MSSLIVVSGPSEGDYYPMQQQTVVVGRDAACPIQIVDELISRVHLELHFDEPTSSYQAKDLNSANGVKINGHDITRTVELMNGDLIEIGGSRLMYFTQEFPDQKSAWDYYKLADQRRKATLIDGPDARP